MISPFESDRREAEAIIGRERFTLVHVTAPLEVCEQRDPKGLYRRARAGEIARFTGISDPFEEPNDPALTLDTAIESVSESIRRLTELLELRGVLPESPR